MPVGVVVVAASTSAGNQTINGPTSMGTRTPKGVIVEWTRGVTSGTVAAAAQIGRGAWDGTTVKSCAAATEDNVSIASGVDSHSIQSNSALIQILRADSQAIDGEADPVSFNAGNVIINWTDALSAAFLLTVTFVWGDDWDFYVGSYVGDPDINDIVTITGIPFRPRGLLLWSPIAGGGISNDAAFSAGVAAINEDGTVQGQNCHGWHCVDQPTIVTVQASEARNDVALVRLRGNAVTGAVTEECRHLVMEGTADGFKVQTLGGSSGMLGLFVALRKRNMRTWCSMPTLGIDTTGLKTVTPGFSPGVVFGLPTMVPVGSVNTALTTDVGIGCAVSCPDGTQRNSCISAEDNAATSDSYSLSNPNFAGLNVAGVGDWAAAVTNRGRTSFDFNVTNAAAVDVLTGFLVFEGTFEGPMRRFTRAAAQAMQVARAGLRTVFGRRHATVRAAPTRPAARAPQPRPARFVHPPGGRTQQGKSFPWRTAMRNRWAMIFRAWRRPPQKGYREPDATTEGVPTAPQGSSAMAGSAEGDNAMAGSYRGGSS